MLGVVALSLIIFARCLHPPFSSVIWRNNDMLLLLLLSSPNAAE
jgi:hypothetical protein